METATKNFFVAALTLAADIVFGILYVIVKGALLFERHILKAYLNIEGPLYRKWWRGHAAAMQRKLDNEHSQWGTFTI